MNRATNHPDSRSLLEYLDGEVAPGGAERLRTHLQDCWRCRAEIEDLQQTTGEYARYQRAVFDATPEPPVSWESIGVRPLASESLEFLPEQPDGGNRRRH
jgi:anti-sigma factor RsiW